MTLAQYAEDLLEDLAESLQVPQSRYEAAERSYKSVGQWLHREASCFRDADPQVYIQGSFRLGTVIAPYSDEEDYDVDLVCELALPKVRLTQAQLKAAFGREMRAYADAHQMEPPEEGRRCWTLHYAESAQFHLDTLPAIPDGVRKRLLLEQHDLPTDWSETAIAITDRDHPRYRERSEDWPHSNPKGYTSWFHSRMAIVFEERRRKLARQLRESVEDIPDYTVRTPLQYAIQILKRHRDVMFVDRIAEKPISIILTTLAAHAYQQETTIAGALYSILGRMHAFIENRQGIVWVVNPTDPAENFADRWREHPERQAAFFEWLEQAKADFHSAAEAANREAALRHLEPRIGRKIVEAVQARRPSSRGNALLPTRSGRRASPYLPLNPSHRKEPPWPAATQGQVQIARAMMECKGFRTQPVTRTSRPLPKHASLTFEANTNVPQPYDVYWQVVNTGHEAEAANGLRGGFDKGDVTTGKLKRRESTLYTGRHSIECFIVKDDVLAARSGQFIVNIR